METIQIIEQHSNNVHCSWGPFGNLTAPTTFSGLEGTGYRTDNREFASVTFVQDVGISEHGVKSD